MKRKQKYTIKKTVGFLFRYVVTVAQITAVLKAFKK
jgi:hypothetical protein